MKLDAVIDHLVTLFDGALSVPVIDGPVPDAAKHKAYVLVGSTGNNRDDGASCTLAASDLGPGNWLDETGEVICSAWAWDGNTALATRRSDVFDLAAQCAAALLGDRHLGGLLHLPAAIAGGFRYRAAQTPNGAIAGVEFTVAYQALIS